MRTGTNVKPERLAPVGRRDVLEAVIAAGADAACGLDENRQGTRT